MDQVSDGRIGALLRHLRGILTQWILSGLGGRADARDRAGEFAGPPSGDALSLLVDLEATVEEVCAVIRAQDAESLAAMRDIQGYRVTGLKRAGAGHGLSYYDDSRLNAAKNP